MVFSRWRLAVVIYILVNLINLFFHTNFWLKIKKEEKILTSFWFSFFLFQFVFYWMKNQLIHFVNEFKETHKMDLSNNLESLVRLRSECEKAKILLSTVLFSTPLFFKLKKNENRNKKFQSILKIFLKEQISTPK